ncbi:MEKHLA domain-containing protein [Carnobacterium maltaromaticum]|uniref:MEKHLA domain-containing protein n=1 Tax=Carnobacterium maltaromaticum TaxID=2751 RepID=UPI0039B03039
MKDYTIYQLLSLLDQSYQHWTGQKLNVPKEMEGQRLFWLDEQSPYGLLAQNIDEQSPYGLLAQNIDVEPLFIYANKKSQNMFGYTLEEFLLLPSSHSASPTVQKDRNQLVQEVMTQGIVTHYQGTRVDKNGYFFEITQGSIWKLLNESGETLGIAAMITSNNKKGETMTKLRF